MADVCHREEYYEKTTAWKNWNGNHECNGIDCNCISFSVLIFIPIFQISGTSITISKHIDLQHYLSFHYISV